MKNRTPIIAGAIALLGTAICAVPNDADARRFSGGARAHTHAHVTRNINRNVTRNVTRNVNRNVVVRRPGRWVNGVWIVNGVAASVAIGTASNCGYYYRKWQETGSGYWRDRYNEHCR